MASNFSFYRGPSTTKILFRLSLQFDFSSGSFSLYRWTALSTRDLLIWSSAKTKEFVNIITRAISKL